MRLFGDLSSRVPLTDYQKVIVLSRYSGFLKDKQRREEPHEITNRVVSFFKKEFTPAINQKIPWFTIQQAINNRDVLPSMRAMLTAGPALQRDHIAGYNCSYLPIQHYSAFDEIMFILMCGTGVGFSVESKYVSQLPVVPVLKNSRINILFSDSREGWASGYRETMSQLYQGNIPTFDLSKIRPKGSPLETFGGRASGPEALKSVLDFTIKTFQGAQGRKLKPIECHDIACKISEIIVCGGVRRSALISLSDLEDKEMAKAKSGEWWIDNPQRALANNSAVYNDIIPMETFIKEWTNIYQSKSGERGIFSRYACQNIVKENGRREVDDFGTNPCSEIILRPFQFCNLSEVVIRPNDTIKSIRAKVELATIIGTIQSTLTDFRYISKKWKENCDEERLLGVSLTGIYDNSLTSTIGYNLSKLLETLKNDAIRVNKYYANLLGIPQSKAITCIKPSGTVSQYAGCSSGIHPPYSEYYLRNVRFDKDCPIGQFLISQGYSYEEDFYNKGSIVIGFPMQSPLGEKTKVTLQNNNELQHLELCRYYQKYYCEHKPSVTFHIKEDKWMKFGARVFELQDQISGISMLPVDNGTYKQAPYQKISKEEYQGFLTKQPVIDWTLLKENVDKTIRTQELACTANGCSL